VQLIVSPVAILIARTVEIAVAVKLLLGVSRLLSGLTLLALLTRASAPWSLGNGCARGR
jgi:hypothetical protein